MTEQHQITPPPELVRQWAQQEGEGPTDEELYELWEADGEGDFQECRRFARAVLARWGANAELLACCYAIYEHEGRPLCGGTAEWLRAARRPKPPSLKKQAQRILVENGTTLDGRTIAIIRRALEQLDD